MALSKKHYEAIAREIRDELGGLGDAHPSFTPVQVAAARATLYNLTIKLCTTFGRDNPNFDGQRFLAACGF